MTTVIHPSQVLAGLLEKVRRSNKRRNLEAVSRICEDIYNAGGTDYSYALVGRMSERQGGPAANTFYSTASSDYRMLVDAWEAFARSNGRLRPSKINLATDEDLLKSITDPSARMLFGIVIAERNSLRKQLDTLRSQNNVVVDLRALPGVAVTDRIANSVVQVVTAAEGLLPSQVASFQRAISPKFLSSMGWKETSDGEVVVERTGEVIFGPGFTHAIRTLTRQTTAP